MNFLLSLTADLPLSSKSVISPFLTYWKESSAVKKTVFCYKMVVGQLTITGLNWTCNFVVVCDSRFTADFKKCNFSFLDRILCCDLDPDLPYVIRLSVVI